MNQQQVYGKSYGGTAAENYQRFFVPTIGAPVADDLIAIAGLQPGERVLDVACGTGVVTRLAAERVGAAGSVTGLDINPGMLAVASSATPSDMSINWHEANAESMPFSDSAFDVVLCQMAFSLSPASSPRCARCSAFLRRTDGPLSPCPGPSRPYSQS